MGLYPTKVPTSPCIHGYLRSCLLRALAHQLIACLPKFANARGDWASGSRYCMKKDLVPGDHVPAFSIITDNAGSVSSASLKGKPFILYFYPKDDTSGCTKEAVAFSENKRKFDALGVEIIGVSKDSTQSHEKFRAKHKLKIVLGSDPEKHLAEAFGVWIEKTLYGRTYMGMDRATFLIDGGGVIKQIWRKVRVPGHIEAVLAAAKSL